MKNILFLLLFSVFTFKHAAAQSQQKIGVDTLKVGDSASAYDSTIELLGTNVKIKASKSTGKAQFTNDGSIWKNLGSGSGSGSSGVNLIKNSGFEDDLAGAVSAASWTVSGGSVLIVAHSNQEENNLNFARFTASAGGDYFETATHAVPSTGDFSTGCMSDIKYYSTNSDFKIQVYEGATLIGEKTLVANSKLTGSSFITYSCPIAGTTVKLRILAASAGVIDIDDAHDGSNKNVVNVAQSRIAGSSYFAGTTNCTWQRSSNSMGAFTADADCPGPTISSSSVGLWQSTDADLPRQTINNLPEGKYKVSVTFANGPSVAAGAHGYTLSDGTTTCQNIATGSSALSTSDSTTVVCEFTYTQPGNRYFEIYANASTGSTANLYNADVRAQTSFVVEYYPLDSQAAMTSEQSGWMVDASIGGANPSLGTSSISSYTEIANAGLDLVLNDGSAIAKIPCSSTNSSTGLTCSAGNEGLGIVFTPPKTGRYEVCGEFTHSVENSTGGYVEGVFQFVETTTNTQTIIQEGKGRSQSGMSSGNVTGVFSRVVCGTFKFDSITEKTIRLMYEQNVGGTVATNTIIIDRNALRGQRDMHITVRPLTSEFDRMVLTGTEVTSSKDAVLHKARVSAAGVVSNESADFVTGNCSLSTNVFNCPLNTTLIGSSADCWVQVNAAGQDRCQNMTGYPSSSLEYATFACSTNTSSAYAATIFCMGNKP